MSYRNKKPDVSQQPETAEEYNSFISLDKSAYTFDNQYLSLIFNAIGAYRNAISQATDPNDFRINASFRILLAISGRSSNQKFKELYEKTYLRLKTEKLAETKTKTLTDDQEQGLMRLAETETLAEIMDYFIGEHDLIQLHVIGVM